MPFPAIMTSHKLWVATWAGNSETSHNMTKAQGKLVKGIRHWKAGFVSTEEGGRNTVVRYPLLPPLYKNLRNLIKFGGGYLPTMGRKD